MSSIVIAKLNNDSDTNLLVQMIKRVHGKAKILKGKSLEDFYFGQLIDKGMQSENVPLEKLRAKLRK